MTATWHALLAEIYRVQTNAHSSLHGDLHWRAVAQASLDIVDRCNGSKAVALAFSMIHDCLRENDFEDPEHGRRSAEWARNSRLLEDLIGKDAQQMVAKACYSHALGLTSDNHDIGLCWDADRINLWRVDIIPDQNFFSIIQGRDFEELKNDYEIGWRTPQTWDDIIDRVINTTEPQG